MTGEFIRTLRGIDAYLLLPPKPLAPRPPTSAAEARSRVCSRLCLRKLNLSNYLLILITTWKQGSLCYHQNHNKEIA